MNKSNILQIDHDFSQMNLGHTYLNQGKIKNFNDKYEGLIRIFKREVNDLQKQYFVMDNGQIKIEGEGVDRKFVMLEGKTIEQYNEAYNKWGVKEV